MTKANRKNLTLKEDIDGRKLAKMSSGDYGVADPVYADAVRSLEKADKVRQQYRKIESTPKREEKPKKIDSRDVYKKLHLSESLFDDTRDDELANKSYDLFKRGLIDSEEFSDLHYKANATSPDYRSNNKDIKEVQYHIQKLKDENPNDTFIFELYKMAFKFPEDNNLKELKIIHNAMKSHLNKNESLKESRVAKTKEVYVLKGKYDNGWEDLVEYDDYKEAKRDYKTYEKEEPNIEHKLVTRRVPKTTNTKNESLKESKRLNESLTDAIFDRMDGEHYDPNEFYNYLMGFDYSWYQDITRAMDYGEEEDVANALINGVKHTIRDDGGNPDNPNAKQLYDWIRNTKWLEETDVTAPRPKYLSEGLLDTFGVQGEYLPSFEAGEQERIERIRQHLEDGDLDYLYNEFDFEDNESINDAYFDDNDQLHIIYTEYDTLSESAKTNRHLKEDREINTLDELNLPSTVMVDINDIDTSDYDELEEYISNYLSDTYGFTHYGFNFKETPKGVKVYDIEWDVDDINESLKEDFEEKTYNIYYSNFDEEESLYDTIKTSDIIKYMDDFADSQSEYDDYDNDTHEWFIDEDSLTVSDRYGNEYVFKEIVEESLREDINEEQAKFLGYMVEFVEGDHTKPEGILSKERVESWLGLNDTLAADQLQGNGYDKAYIDLVYQVGNDKIAIHVIRKDLGDGYEYNDVIEDEEIEYAEDVLKNYLETGETGYGSVRVLKK